MHWRCVERADRTFDYKLYLPAYAERNHFLVCFLVCFALLFLADELGYLVDAIVNDDMIETFDKRPNDMSIEVKEKFKFGTTVACV